MRALILVCAALITAPALAQEAAPAPAAAPEPAKEKKVCRSEAVMGSIMARRTCHTRAEWAEIDKANRQNVDNFNDRRTTNRSSVGG